MTSTEATITDPNAIPPSPESTNVEDDSSAVTSSPGTDGSVTTEDIKEEKSTYPKASVAAIVVGASSERFFYVGLATILTLYLSDVLRYNEDDATLYFHNFIQMSFTFSFIFAILADSKLDKFKAIGRASAVYVVGGVVLFAASFPDSLSQTTWSQIGLTLIAAGTGGLKPCIPAFGGDQFTLPKQEEPLEKFFSLLHFCGTAAALVATITMPFLRSQVHCFGDEFCFPLPFGIALVFLILYCVIFFGGTKFYTINRNQGRIFRPLRRSIIHAIVRKIKLRKEETREHWMDFADDEYEKSFVEEVKQFLRVLLVFAPIPMFWALFEQQGSRWIFQASRMDGTLGSVVMKPDQFLIVAPLVVLLVAPVLDLVVYPSLGEVLTPLKKIGIAGFLAGVAFVLAGVVELQIEHTYAPVPANGQTSLNFLNTLHCDVEVNVRPNESFAMEASSHFVVGGLPADEQFWVTVNLEDPRCGNVTFSQAQLSKTVHGESAKEFSVIITGHNETLEMTRMDGADPLEKTRSGEPRLQFIWSSDDDGFVVGSIKISGDGRQYDYPVNLSSTESAQGLLIQTDDRPVEAGTYEVLVVAGGKTEPGDEVAVGQIHLKQGGSYVVVVQQTLSQPGSRDRYILQVQVSPPSTVHMLWLLPQFFLLNVAEVLFAATGNHFAYIESPVRLRTMSQSAWLLTGSVGNLIVMAVVESNSVKRQAIEFFLFAGIMGLDLIVFTFLAIRFKYTSTSEYHHRRH